jgi:predicted N-acetyltransferase YhbS
MDPLVHDGDAVTITLESAADVAARDALLARAMSVNWKRKTSQKLRSGRIPAEGLAFVARDNQGRIIGTVRLWNIQAGIDAVGRPVPALMLGPLAVDPESKSRGTGSLLMRHALSEAARLGHGAVLLVGDAPYYARFGFSAEKTGALALPGPVERDRFLALELEDGWLDGAAGMVVATGCKKTREKARKLRLVA